VLARIQDDHPNSLLKKSERFLTFFHMVQNLMDFAVLCGLVHEFGK
jgi:hypothetical protein